MDGKGVTKRNLNPKPLLGMATGRNLYCLEGDKSEVPPNPPKTYIEPVKPVEPQQNQIRNDPRAHRIITINNSEDKLTVKNQKKKNLYEKQSADPTNKYNKQPDTEVIKQYENLVIKLDLCWGCKVGTNQLI